jgi:hypothetical protein
MAHEVYQRLSARLEGDYSESPSLGKIFEPHAPASVMERTTLFWISIVAAIQEEIPSSLNGWHPINSSARDHFATRYNGFPLRPG